jgi:hypothetical protein
MNGLQPQGARPDGSRQGRRWPAAMRRQAAGSAAVLLAQQVLLHLAHRVARQVGTTKTRLGTLKLAMRVFSAR